MSRIGLLEPIVVYKGPNEKYQLIAGFHRLAAAVRLKWETIEAHVRVKDKTPVKAMALAENIIRRDLSLQEECDAVAHLHHEEKLSPSQICDLLNKSRSWVDRRLTAPNLPEYIRIALWEGQISLAAAEAIGVIEDEGTRNYILNQTISGRLTNPQVADLIKLYLENPDMEEAIHSGLKGPGKVEAPQKRMWQCESCGKTKPLNDLVSVWVCKEGCRPRTDQAPEDQGETK